MNNPETYPNQPRREDIPPLQDDIQPKQEEVPVRDPSQMDSSEINNPYENPFSYSPDAITDSENDHYEKWNNRLEGLEADFQRSVQDSSDDPYWARTWESFKEKFADIKQQLSNSQNRLPDAWENMKTGIQKSIEELEEGYKRAKAEFENSSATGRQ